MLNTELRFALPGAGRLALLVVILLGPATVQNCLAADTPCGGQGQLPCPCQPTQPPCVLTAAYDNQRDGYNPNETTLTITKVQSGLTHANTFPVDTNDLPLYLNSGTQIGASNPIVAQPLYVSGITVAGSQVNMVTAVTLNGTVFAWNADTRSLLWSRQGSGNAVGHNSLPVDDCTTDGIQRGTVGPVDWGASNSLPFAGIVSTPVIDLSPSGSTTPSATPVMFLTSWCQDNIVPPNRKWYLHEIDLTTGLDHRTPNHIVGESSPSTPLIYANGWDNADDIDVNGHVPFIQKYQMQRPALLEVKNPNATSGPSHVIYIGFGAGTYEKSAGGKGYHGWVLAFTTGSDGAITPVTTTNGPNAFADTPLGCGAMPLNGVQQPNCDGFYNPQSYGWPACNCLTPSGYRTTPNYAGHGAGIWSSRALAATSWGALNDGAAHIFANTGNGGFQNTVASSGQEPNFGDSIVDLKWAGGTPTSMQPYQSFTPYGGPLICTTAGDSCDTSTAVPVCKPSGLQCHPCTALTNPPCAPAVQPPLNPAAGINFSVEALNVNDWDLTAGPIMVFNDLNGKPKVITADKAGYGYLLDPSNFCNPNGGTSGCKQAGSTNMSFAAGDPGNVFPFAAAQNSCPNLASTVIADAQDCDRVTSFAFYNSSVYYWPYREDMVALKLSNSSASSPINGVGNITTCGTPSGTPASCPLPAAVSTTNPNWGFASGGAPYSPYPLVQGSYCTSGACPYNCTGGTCFSYQVAAGDQISFQDSNGHTRTVTVTAVIDNANLAVSPGFSPDAPSTGTSFQYWGYLVNASQDQIPEESTLGYPGGSIDITANNGSNAIVWAIASDWASGTTGSGRRTRGKVLAYNATPNTQSDPYGGGVLTRLWSSDMMTPSYPIFCASSFALPTVVNGTVFVPTYAVPTSNPACPSFTANPGTTPFLSGMLALN